MKVKYFSDTDTAHIEFTNNEVDETRQISENIYIDLDAAGNLVSMTIEHAKAIRTSGNFLTKKCPTRAPDSSIPKIRQAT